jgi:hypothetical protein
MDKDTNISAGDLLTPEMIQLAWDTAAKTILLLAERMSVNL